MKIRNGEIPPIKEGENKMKKFLALLLALICCLAIVACDQPNETADDPNVLSYSEYAAAELDSKVVVEAYVQATQSWWDNKINVYLQDKDGAYFVYDLACSEDDAKKLVPGTMIRVEGTKIEWSGEVEIKDATFTFVEGADKYVATAQDLTSVLADEAELIKHQNELAIFKGLTIEEIEYKNEGGDDIYVTVKQGDNTFAFCVEMYLTGPDTDVYKAFADLKAGDVVDITGFVYWYNGVNTHITAVSAAK